MSVVTEVSPDGKKLTISIEGRFDFGRHQEFRESYEKLNNKPDSIVVDLKKATYLDSSALGMLCLLYTSPSPRDQRGSRMPSSA